MKKLIFFLSLLLLVSCATQQTVQRQMPLLAEIPDQTLGEPVLSPKEVVEPLFGEFLSEVKTSKSSCNPSQGEELVLSYRLAKPAKVTVSVYDPDWGLVRTFVSEEQISSGDQSVVWDGKDDEGSIVPDEAYFFSIIAEDESGIQEVYDPTTFSGGEEYDITKADVDPQSGTISYQMPEMGRVMIRIGVQGGPLLNPLVDWEPRAKGMVTEYWNGKDSDNLVDLYRHPKFKMIVAYFTFPENSVITFGNKSQTYKGYKNLFAAERPVKEERKSVISKFSHHYRFPRVNDYSPVPSMVFSNVQGTDKNGVPILKGKTLVKIDLNEEDKALFTNQQFEIVFFLDNEFYAEDESGYTPFNWVWDLSGVEEGEHLFTVNLSSFKDQVGVISRKVRVVK